MIQNRVNEKQELLNLIKYFFVSNPDSIVSLDSKSKENSNNNEYDEIKLAILSSLENFLRSSKVYELNFPLSFSLDEQLLVQIAAEKIGLKSQIIKKSKTQSAVIVYKNTIKSYFHEPMLFNVTWNSRRSVLQFLTANPFTIKEKQEINHKPDKDGREDRHRGTTGKLMDAVPQVPLIKTNDGNSTMLPESVFSPIWSSKTEIIEAIKQNSIVIISSASGCGKTTQIGQIIMQECAKAGEPCRMICTQPYRLTAHAYAQFVTQQRKENIGQTVGYQIRLESKVSPRTLLTFCTNEVLLRTLYGDRAFLNGTTHIIVDEVQERCKHSDLLLCVLNKMQKIHRHIKIIILISTPIIPHDIIQTSSPRTKNSYYNRQYNITNASTSKEKQNHFGNVIRQYFEFCPTIYVRKPAQDIEELFLEDILNIVDCKFYNLDKYKTPYKVDLFKLTFEKWFSYWMSRQKTNDNMDLNLFEMFYKNTNSNLYAENLMNYDLSSVPNVGMMSNPFNNQTANTNFNNQIDYVTLYDETLWLIWSRFDIDDIPMNFNFDLENFDVSKLGNFYMSSSKNEPGVVGNNYFKFLFSIISNRFVSVNHQHRMSALTALMICGFRGMKNAVIRLLSLGADVTIPLIVTENIYQAHILYMRTLRTSHQLNKNIEFYNKVLAAYQNRYSIHNILYVSDLGLITRNFEIADLIFSRIACISEHMNLRNVTINNYEITNCKPIPFVEDTEFMYSLIKGLLKTIDKNTDTGTILIFLPDYNHLVQLKTILLASNEEIFDKVNKYQIYLLHSWMMIQDLNSLLSNVTSNCRKIILSTCIGESSLNINDISFVIDTGIETKKVYDEILDITTLKTVYISKAQAAYRASRVSNSINRFCFHLYSSSQYHSFEDNKVAEILTHPLNEVVLQMKLLTAIGASVNQFLGSLMDSPTPESSKSSIMLLKSIGALDSFEEITELGYHLYDLPLDPKYGKMVLMSVLLKCLDPILTISCILNLQDPFLEVSTDLKYKELMEIKKKFSSNTFSDHMVLLRVFQFWQKSRAEGWENTFCQKNYLSTAVFDIITGIRTQLLGQLRASGFVKARGNGDIRDLNYNSENWAIVKAAIVSGLPNKYLLYNPTHSILVGNMNAKVVPHPTSTLYNCESSSFLSQCNYSTNVFIYDKSITSPNVSNTNWNEYNCLVTNNKIVQAKCMTMVTAATVALLGANVDIIHSESDNQDTNRDNCKIGFDMSNSNQDDSHIYFKADEELCQLILKLRQKWQFTVMRKLKNPSKQSTPQDEAILRTIVNVLTLEEQSYGLKQPYGVGARPRPMAPEYCNQNDSCAEFCKPNSLNDSFGTDYVRNNLIHDKRGVINQCENKALSSELMKTQITEQKEVYSSSVIPLDKSRFFNSGTNHFFIIKLLHESEMSGILNSQIYKVNTSLKLQIEHLLFKGFTIYFIFINGSNSVLLGYARILQVIYPEVPDINQPSFVTDNSECSFNRNQTFSLSLDVYPGKLENNSQTVDIASLSITSSEPDNSGKQWGISEDNQKSVVGENINKVLFIPQYFQNTKLFN